MLVDPSVQSKECVLLIEEAQARLFLAKTRLESLITSCIKERKALDEADLVLLDQATRFINDASNQMLVASLAAVADHRAGKDASPKLDRLKRLVEKSVVDVDRLCSLLPPTGVSS